VLRFIAASSGADRLRAAGAFVEGSPAANEVLIVGASRDAADDLARRVTAMRGATFGLHRASLMQLAVRVAAVAMARLGVAPATALGAEAVAARVAFEALRERTVGYFAPVARFPGFAQALAATLGELRLGGVTAGALDNVDGPARDVAELARRFEAQLDDGKIADRAALLAMATRALRDASTAPLRRMPMLLLDVPINGPVERAFVQALTNDSPAVLVTVAAGDDATLDALRSMGARETEADRSDGGGDLARAREFLFAANVPAGAPSGDVVLFSAPGEGRETVEIARRILDEARAGTPFDEMAVLLRAPEIYGSLLEVALRRAGVPAWFARGTKRPDPSGRAFLALLDCALENLSARRFAEYLSLGQVPPLDAAGAPPTDRAVWAAPEDETLGPAADPAVAENVVENATADGGTADGTTADPTVAAADADDHPVVAGTLRAPWRWEQLLVESAVIGGRERWSRRLRGLEAEYKARLEQYREDEPRAAAITRDLANLAHLRRFAVPVIERLTALPQSGTWGEWIAALEALAPMVLRRPERVLTVLAALRPLDVIGPVALGEVRDVLADELTTLAEPPPKDRYGRVFVGTIEQARGRAFEIVFLPGLAERIFPQKPREDPILLDTLRRELGAGLATQDERGRRERLLLRLAVGAARRRLHLSYSRIEQTEARPRVPSFYALEVARALTGTVPEPQRMERDAALAAGARLAWPAPDDPARALDEVEHDLATLRALLAGGEARGQGPERREALGPLVVEEVQVGLVGQPVVVQAVRAAAADDGTRALVELHAHRAGHVPLTSRDVPGQVLVQRGEPEPVVDEVGVLLCDLRLEAQRIARQHHLLERLVRRVEDDRRRCLIDLA
jgi:hypothetical protein